MASRQFQLTGQILHQVEYWFLGHGYTGCVWETLRNILWSKRAHVSHLWRDGANFQIPISPRLLAKKALRPSYWQKTCLLTRVQDILGSFLAWISISNCRTTWEIELARRTHLLTTWTILPSPAHEPHRYSKVSVWCAWAMALKKIVAWNLTWNLTGLPAWSIHLVSSFYQGATLAMMCECVCDPTNLRSSTEKGQAKDQAFGHKNFPVLWWQLLA